MRRKLLYIIFLFMIGIFLGGCIFSRRGIENFHIILVLLFIGGISFLQLKEFRWKTSIALICGFCLFAFFLNIYDNNKIRQYLGSEVELEGTICSFSKKADKRQYVISIKKINGNGDVSCWFKNKCIVTDKDEKIDANKPMGATVGFSGILEIPEKAANPRGFDYRNYLYSEGISYTCSLNSVSDIIESDNLKDRINNNVVTIKERFIEKLSTRGAALAEGILFGNTSGIDDVVLEGFQRNGTAHVLAVSGLHIGIIFAVYDYLNKKFRSKVLSLSFIFFLYIYGVITMWPVSVCRAQLLVLLKMAADRLERPFDLSTGLAAVAGIMCLKNPFTIFSLSFQMSFLAVFILATIPRAIERIRGKHINGGIVIQLALIPYMAYIFNYISLIGILANIPVIFLISTYVPIGIFTFLIFALAGAVPEMFLSIIEGLGNMTAKVNDIFYLQGVTSKDIVSISPMIIAIFYGALFFVVSEEINIEFLRKQYKQIVLKGITVLMIFTLGSFVSKTSFDNADLVFLDVGYGDSLHIKYEYFNVLIDGGGFEKGNIAKKVLKPYLLKNGARDVKLVLGTCLNEEHYLGLIQLKNTFDVHESKIWCEAGEKISGMKEGFIEVLWPVEADVKNFDGGKKGNVFKVYFEGVTCLVAGDLNSDGEKALVEHYKGSDKLKSDILKVSGHGSNKSSCEEFLNAVNPKVAIISAGENKSQKPSDEVIEKIHQKDIILYMTDKLGAVGIDIDGESFTVCTMEKSTPSKYSTKN